MQWKTYFDEHWNIATALAQCQDTQAGSGQQAGKQIPCQPRDCETGGVTSEAPFHWALQSSWVQVIHTDTGRKIQSTESGNMPVT